MFICFLRIDCIGNTKALLFLFVAELGIAGLDTADIEEPGALCSDVELEGLLDMNGTGEGIWLGSTKFRCCYCYKINFLFMFSLMRSID